MEYRQSETADLKALFKLFVDNEYFEPAITFEEFERLYRWQAFESPGQIKFQIIAKKQEDIVAHYGLISLPFKKGHEKIIAGFGSNLLIDKENRNGLLFFELQGRYLREPLKKGIAFIYGLVTRPLVLQTHLKTGYKEIGELPILARPIRVNRLVQQLLSIPPFLNLCFSPLYAIINFLLRFSLLGRASSIQVRAIKIFEKDWDFLFEKWLASYPLHAQRTAATLNWRFFGNPDRPYQIWGAFEGQKIVGYVVTRKMMMKQFDCLALVDLICDPEHSDAPSALMRVVHLQAQLQKVDLVSTIYSPIRHFVKRAFTRFGFLKTPEKFTLVVNSKGNAIQENDFKDWLVTWYDHDVV